MATPEASVRSSARRFLPWGGVGVSLAAIVAFVFSRRSPAFAHYEWSQLLIALGFVVGPIILILGRSSSLTRDWLDRITISLAIAAIVFALWQFHDARVQDCGWKVWPAK